MTLDFDAWYREVRDELVDSVARAVADDDAATEAVDEAFARAVERWEQVATLRAPNGWVYTVAVNAARRTFRRRGMESSRLADLARSTPASAVGEIGPGHDGIDELLASLPPAQRHATRLRVVDGLTEREIAERLGVTRSTVSSTLRSAYRSLARQLRPPRGENRRMNLHLARVRHGHPDGCDVTYLDADTTEKVRFGAAVLDRIRIRRDDLVAVDLDAEPPEIVWRWWHGLIESIDGAIATTRRPAGSEGGSALKDVHLPAGLRSAARVSTSIWFGTDDDRLVAVAVAGHPDAARSALSEVEAAYE